MKTLATGALALFSALNLMPLPASSDTGGPEKRSPKKVIAVSNFQVTAQDYTEGGGWWNRGQIGHGMRSMLVEALVKTGKFIVVERGEGLQEIRAEQALKTSGESRGSGAEARQLIAAQALFRGEITDFTPGQQGAKVSAGRRGAGDQMRGLAVTGRAAAGRDGGVEGADTLDTCARSIDKN